MHPTVQKFHDMVLEGNHEGVSDLMADDIRFMPPTYWATWRGREAVSAVLGHVGEVFEDFRYRRVLGEDDYWILEFECKIDGLDCVGLDLMTLNEAGEMQQLEVVMRPHKTVGALREAMNKRVATDPRFLKLREALS